MKEQWLDTAFSGEGARRVGGRWNAKGTPLVYPADSIALAALEILVHLDHKRALDRHWALPVDFDEEHLEAVDVRDLPEDFPNVKTVRATQRIGDAWVQHGSTPLLRVPSAVVPQEFNYLLNPHHAAAPDIAVGEPIPFQFDRRLGGGRD